MLDCPHCNKRGISFIRKLFLGDKSPATCRHCGGKMIWGRVKKNGVITPLIPIGIGLVIANWGMNNSPYIHRQILFFVFIVISYCLLVSIVPLVPPPPAKQKSSSKK